MASIQGANRASPGARGDAFFTDARLGGARSFAYGIWIEQAEEIDLAAVRGDTPGVEEVVHLNNAGAALPPTAVVDAVQAHVALEARIGGYEAEERNREQVDRVYGAAAALLHCEPEEVAFVENATRAWDMAFYSLDFGPGDRILTSSAEYVSNYVAFLHAARRTGVTIEVIPDDQSGQVSVDELEWMLDERVKLIAVTHVPTNGGLVNPAAAIGQVANTAGIPFLLDACQSVGQLSLDVAEIGCDLLSLTGRKYLRGPRGTGLLYARRRLLEQLHPPMIDLRAAPWVARDRYELRSDAKRFESWECNFAGKIGLGVAIDYALKIGLDKIEDRVHRLAELLRRQLEEIDGVTVRDLGRQRCGIVSFTVAGIDPCMLREQLSQRRVNVWYSDTSSTRIDMERRGLDNLVRASVHYYNTEEELELLCAEVRAHRSHAISPRSA